MYATGGVMHLEDGEGDEMHQSLDDGDNVVKKDWFGPAIASMARLNQIQASVYNMGLHSPDVLKPTHKIKRNQQHQMTDETQKSTHKPMLYEDTQDEESGMCQELALRKTQPSPLHKETAWGSNHSIPELMARQNRPIVHRPSSAKILSECRLKTASTLKGRPQSAKEPLCKNDDQRKRRTLGVMGSKKTVLSTKPPLRPTAPIEKHPLINKAWAGPPPGYKMNPDEVMQDPTQMREDALTAPCSSPVGSDDESVDEEAGKAPPLLRRPLATPIHLSLPSADEVLDMNRDEEDKKQEPDTDRLLKEADNFMKKQRDSEKIETKKNPQSWNATLPENSVASAQPHSNSIGAIHRNSCDIKEESVRTLNMQENMRTKNENAAHRNSGHLEQIPKRNVSSGGVKGSNNSHEPVVDDHELKSRNMENTVTVSKVGVQIREDRNITVDITPRNVGRKVIDKTSSFSKKTDLKSESSIDHSECPCAINLEDLSLTDKERRDLIQYRSNNKTMKTPAKESFVSMVSVEYEEDNQIIIEKKTPIRKKKRMSEIETLVSQLSQGEPGNHDINQDKNDDISITDLLHKSQPEKNYYEIACRKTQRLTRPAPLNETLKENPDKDMTVYKTTKTMEFDSELEISMKSAICSQSPAKIKKEPSIPISYTIRPTKHKDTKQDSLKKDPSAKNSTEIRIGDQELEADMDILEGMLLDAKAMAQSSINGASRSRPPSGRATNPQNKPRPASSYQNKVKTESKPKPRPLLRASSLSDIDKVSPKPPQQDTRSTSKQYCRHTAKLPPTGVRSTCRPTIDDIKPLVISTVRSKTSFDTPSSLHCKEMQSKMSAFGLDVDANLLERALYPPSGNNLYYEVPGELPKDLSAGLLSHYKHWLPEDYKRIKIMEKRLAQDDHIRYLQELAAKKKAKKPTAKLKGKKGKKKKLMRRNSVS